MKTIEEMKVLIKENVTFKTKVVCEILVKNRVGGGLANVVSKDYQGTGVGFGNDQGAALEQGQYWEAWLDHGRGIKTLRFIRRLSDLKPIALSQGGNQEVRP